MFIRKITSRVISLSKTRSCKFASEAATPNPGNPATVKGSVGAVFAEEGQPFNVTLEEGKIYSWCPCGQSKKKPFCDGTHKEVNLKSELKYRPVKLKVEKTGEYCLCNCGKTKNVPFCDGSHKLKNILKSESGS